MSRIKFGSLDRDDELVLTITLQRPDNVKPLLREQVTCRDVFAAIHELENVSGPRFRQRLNFNLMHALEPPDRPDEPDAGVREPVTK